MHIRHDPDLESVFLVHRRCIDRSRELAHLVERIANCMA